MAHHKQGALFEDIRLTIATEAGIGRAALKLESPEGHNWLSATMDALHALVMRQPELTADDVWEERRGQGEDESAYRSQMGIAFRQAKDWGWIRFSGRSIESRRAPRHRSMIRVWRSLLYRR